MSCFRVKFTGNCLFAVQLMSVHRASVQSHRCLSTASSATPAGGLSSVISIVCIQRFTVCRLGLPVRQRSNFKLVVLVYKLLLW